MGEVYEAVDQVLERRAAIKIMSVDHDQGIEGISFLSMFTLEARALAQIDHPNVVQVYSVGTHDGVPYIAMEYVDGFSLREAIGREVLTVEQALSVFIPLFEALASLHEADVVHRDIKPANLLIRRDGVVKLVDFGIAVRKGWEGTTASTEMGTHDYTAPEVLSGSNSSSSSDLWSAGAVLFESLVGVKLSRHRSNPHANIEFPEELSARLPAELRRIIVKLCMADPHSRYQRADEVVADLTRLYRLNFPGPIVLNQVFKQNLRKLIERVSLLGGPLSSDDDKTVAMDEAAVALNSRPVPTASPKKAAGLPPAQRRKSTVMADAYKLVKGLALWGALIYFGYSQVPPKQKTQPVAAKPRETASIAQNHVAKNPIVLLKPSAGQAFTTNREVQSVDLVWACVGGAKNYFAQVSRDARFKEITHERRINGCLWKDVALPAGHYYWRVRAEDDMRTWSEARAVIIQRESL
jgi:serine/threonine protein kinase